MIDKEKAFAAFERYRQENPCEFQSALEKMRNNPDLAAQYLDYIYHTYGTEEYPSIFQTEGEFPVPSGTVRPFYVYTDILKQFYPEKYQELLNMAQDDPLIAAHHVVLWGGGYRGIKLLPLFREYMQSLPTYKELELRLFEESAELSLRRERGKRRALRGAGWLLLGALITGATYLLAEQGGTYLICWGVMAFGALYFFIRLLEWLA